MTDAFIKKVGNKIREIRSKKGYTQFQLANQAGVSLQTVQYWESGQNLTLKTLLKLSRQLDYPVDGFLKNLPDLKSRRGRPRNIKIRHP